jgi:hypothetical protein
MVVLERDGWLGNLEAELVVVTFQNTPDKQLEEGQLE